jgi:hypothetical protein
LCRRSEGRLSQCLRSILFTLYGCRGRFLRRDTAGSVSNGPWHVQEDLDILPKTP